MTIVARLERFGPSVSKETLRPLVYGLQAALMVLTIGWVLDVPGRLGIALYLEQFLMAAVGIALALVFMMVPIRGSGTSEGMAPPPTLTVPVYDLVLAAIGFASCGYVAIRYQTLITELVYRPWDGVLVASAIVLLVLEATRRTSGNALTWTILALCFYAMIGWMLPGDFASRPVSLSRLMVYLGIDTNALLSSALQVAAVVIVPFVLMGQILTRAGGGDFFTDISMAMMGRFRGGAGKIAVVGSGFFGMVSGSAVANVATVGTITIPLMKRAGFPPMFAAAVESVGSTGGQLMPPVMGAAAFLMAEYMQVPYSDVMIAAALPAVLYYAALFIQVDLEAAARGIEGAPRETLPRPGAALRDGWIFPIPFIVLIVGLVQFNMEAEYAALIASAVLLILAMTVGYKGKRLNWREAIDAIVSTGGAVLDIIIITAASGLIIGALNITGVAFGLTMQLLAVSGDSLFVLLMITAMVGIILGLGLPTVGVYVILATLAAPALIKAGVTPMQAHMFVMYFGMMSMVTPPVALAAFVAANIAGADFWKTGWLATRIGWAAYIVPFLFAYSPSLLMAGEPMDIVVSFVTAVLGVWLGSAAVVGYLRQPIGWPVRVAVGVAGLLLLVPIDMFANAWISDALGAALAAAVVGWEWMRGSTAHAGT